LESVDDDEAGVTGQGEWDLTMRTVRRNQPRDVIRNPILANGNHWFITIQFAEFIATV
jgi:hypothetical protein